MCSGVGLCVGLCEFGHGVAALGQLHLQLTDRRYHTHTEQKEQKNVRTRKKYVWMEAQ